MNPVEKCPDHRPVQYRDGKEPWCPNCGLTRDYVEPAIRFGAMTFEYTRPTKRNS